VTVLGAGHLTKSGRTFTGWNTAPDGTGTDYSVGDTFSINNHVVLKERESRFTYLSSHLFAFYAVNLSPWMLDAGRCSPVSFFSPVILSAYCLRSARNECEEEK
jgi:hypothetical protein